MFQSSPLLQCFFLLGFIIYAAEAWHVQMPSNIEALYGSCVYIPCTFDYYSNPPKRPNRVVWYQYVNRGYPLVYDNWYPDDVISMYRGRTSRYTSKYEKICSLEIDPVTWDDHRQKLYPWVDPENIGKYTHAFYDTTVKIEVVGRAKEPDIVITGERKVGASVTVQCSVVHTCYVNPPTLTLNIPLLNSHQRETLSIDGTSKTTLTTTLVIERESQTVECSVQHPGGTTAKAARTINAKCSFISLTISPSSVELLEGMPHTITCTASYTCPQQLPTLTWNYANMPATTSNSKESQSLWKTVSTLTLTSSAHDHGKDLKCYAQFDGGRTEKSINLLVKKNMLNLDWSFTTPERLTGLTGSCIVIPCKFTYSKSQPDGLQVIWYLYQSNGYPSVYNQRDGNVVSKFAGKTSLIGSVSERNCSLKIDNLEMSHNKERLFPWIDKSAITSYHSQGHSFLDKTTQLVVTESAQEPQMGTVTVPRVGEEGKVFCKVRHSCLSAPPTLTLNGVSGTERTNDSVVSDGVWERTIERTWTVEEEHKSVECTVSYPGGQKVQSKFPLNVECPYDDIKMIQPPGTLTEGMAKSVICSVSYTCEKNRPVIVWNFPDMQSSEKNSKISKNKYSVASNLTFIGSLGDNGKSLTCTAQFKTGETSAFSVLQIEKYERPYGEDHLHDNDKAHVGAADVPFTFSALTTSCVVIPCTFKGKEYEVMTRGIWSKRTGGIVFHNGRSYVTDHFKDRTRMLGNLQEGDCSLEIDDIKPFDNGPFCFHAMKGEDKYRFNNSCVFIAMTASPAKPEMSSLPAEVNAGSTVTISCSVSHTCSSHPPEFLWSVPNITSEVSDTLISRGVWKRTNTISFMVAAGDGVKSLTCTAVFWGKKQQASTLSLTVKGTLKYKFGNAAPVVIPITLLVLILAAVFGVLYYRKKKQAGEPLSPPPRPEKRSLWDRVSRRYPQGGREKPQRPEKRRSIWSSGADDDRVGWDKERRSFWSRFSRHQDNRADFSVSYLNNPSSVVCNTQVSKQRFPSPKNNHRRPPPATPEVCNLYGNI